MPEEGAKDEESKNYWLGKDLARARDEVVFYEAAKNLHGRDGWQILNFMTPYRGKSLRSRSCQQNARGPSSFVCHVP